jgi:hypothetical protein
VVLASLNGGNRVTTGRQVPFCLFTDPEFARVGLSGKEAKTRGIAYRLFKIPMGQCCARTHGIRAVLFLLSTAIAGHKGKDHWVAVVSVLRHENKN